ncbi:MAG: hypothetical protein U0R50_11635 [Gaiellales bacterium]
MRDRRNAIAWALGMWFLRRALRRRVARGAAVGGGAGRLKGLVTLAAVGGIAFAAWRKLAAGGRPPV